MRTPHTLVLTAALASAPFALAQQAATLADVNVVGASDLLSNFLKVNLSVQPGDALSKVNPKQVEQDALATGFFKSATAELRTISGRDTLVITVVPNPVIKAVNISGASNFDAAQLKTALENQLTIAAGATLNTARLEDSKTLLAQTYRDQGFPFTPGVSATVTEDKDGATINYVVDETAPISQVIVTGSTVLDSGTITAAFRPLVDAKKFSAEAYQAAVQAVNTAYVDKGYVYYGPQGPIPLGGVNLKSTTLEGGVLRVGLLETRVAGIDTSAIGDLKGVVLQTKTGALINQNLLSSDLRALSNAAGKPVTAQLQGEGGQPDRATVVFVPGQQASAPIKDVRISGNTLIPAGDIAKVLQVRVGDVYNQELAVKDYLAIQALYRERGFELSTRDALSFNEGTLTYNVREVKIGRYELQFQGPRVTQDRVILRELPAPGTPFNAGDVRRGIENLLRQGIIKPPQVTTRPDPNNPENIIFTLAITDSPVRSFNPALSYSTLEGFSGSLDFQTNNLFGLAHQLTIGLSAQQNDARQVLGGNLSYTIPWLDIDFLDFRRNRTSISASVGSNVTGNQALLGTDQKPTGREYTTRSTGVQLDVGRQVTPNLSVGVFASTQYNQNYLEPVTPAQQPKPGDPALPDDAASASLLPQNGLTTVIGARTNFDNTNVPEFPTSGFRASLTAGYGFGSEGPNRLSWIQAETGASTYFGFGRTLADGNMQQAIAVRVNGGTILGTAPASRQYSVGGSSPQERYSLKGYNSGQFRGENYITSSAEYRYNFGLNASVLQGLYGVAFLDAGDAWSAPNSFSPKIGYGVGVQVNLGIGGGLLPTLRFDYAFSPANNSGKFTFRLGGFF